MKPCRSTPISLINTLTLIIIREELETFALIFCGLVSVTCGTNQFFVRDRSDASLGGAIAVT